MKMMIMGAGGQLGDELVNILQDDFIIPLTHIDIEITNYQQVNDIISSNMPNVVINTTAYHRVSVYAVSKLAGEYFVRNICTRHYVIRICGLYGAKARRPLYSVLENRNLKRLGLGDIRPWREALREYLVEKGYSR